MSTNPYPSSHPSPLPVLAAVVISAAPLLHLLLGSSTPTRTVLAVLAIATGMLAGVLASLPRTPRLMMPAVTLTGVGAAVLLGVTYL